MCDVILTWSSLFADLSGLNSGEIIYDDTSSDASDTANAVTASKSL